MDAQTAAMFGQQSSQPAGFPGMQPKVGSNEDLALALAAMASSPAMQNAVLGGGVTETPTLQTAMLGGGGGGSQSPVSSVFGNINTGVGAVKTGMDLWKTGSQLYDAIMGATSTPMTGLDIYDAAAQGATAADWASWVM